MYKNSISSGVLFLFCLKFDIAIKKSLQAFRYTLLATSYRLSAARFGLSAVRHRLHAFGYKLQAVCHRLIMCLYLLC
jgi:hypothetical protein